MVGMLDVTPGPLFVEAPQSAEEIERVAGELADVPLLWFAAHQPAGDSSG